MQCLCCHRSQRFYDFSKKIPIRRKIFPGATPSRPFLLASLAPCFSPPAPSPPNMNFNQTGLLFTNTATMHSGCPRASNSKVPFPILILRFNSGLQFPTLPFLIQGRTDSYYVLAFGFWYPLIYHY